MARSCKIKEIPSFGNRLSWGGKRENVWVQCRLDRSFGNAEWFTLFPRAKTEYLEMMGSDHRPILTRLVGEDTCHRGRFCFDKRLINKPETEEIIKKHWRLHSVGAGESVTARLLRCRRALSKWKRLAPTNSHTRITQLKKDLETESTKMFPNFQRLQGIKWDLNKAFREEEIYWKQKSRQKWLREGDRNTTFFHGSVKYKRLKNRVISLLDKHGLEAYEEGSKGSIAVEFFSELFTSSNPTGFEDVLEGMEPRVTEEMNLKLTSPITALEIKQAAFKVQGDSAPGIDGWTGTFFKQYWNTIGKEIVSEVEQFFQSGTMLQDWNHTQICLIPKKPNANAMTDMRPISLCSVLYKIVSNVLCTRLKRCLPKLVSETQGAFVSGRLISDNILIAHEIIHALRTNSKFNKDMIAIKTDMSKAYDRVEWDFLEHLFVKMGFNSTWIQWIMSCVRSVSYTVLINGSSHGFVKPSRGIRQGDPLSPFLFILCAEALVHLMQRRHEQQRLTGFQFNESCPSVQHLLFADDSLFICKANKEECEEVLNCLSLYGKASGQVINFAKSTVTFGGKASYDTKELVKTTLGIRNEGGSGSYLGLPECFSGSKQALLAFIGEKLQGRLHGWFAKSLSLGGKEVLLKSIAMALPVYAMSCFRLSKNLCRKLTSAMTEFWWSHCEGQRNIAWVAWAKLCKAKSEGGLGFKDLSDFNQALLAKQSWRMLNNPTSLVARFFKSRYFRYKSILDCGTGSRPSYAWRSILQGRDLLKKGLLKVIGDGSNTLVWQEKWIQEEHPRAPYRAQIFFDVRLKVSDLRDPSTGHWDVSKIENLFPPGDANRILAMKLAVGQPDRFIWPYNKAGAYTVKSGYWLSRTLPSLYEKPPEELIRSNKLKAKVWRLKTVPKIKSFLWRMLSGALAVADRLACRGISIDLRCPVCGDARETISHTLFGCHVARQAFALANVPLPSGGFSESSVENNWEHLEKVIQDTAAPEEIRSVIPWLLWNVWKYRNTVVFQGKQGEVQEIVIKAYQDALQWKDAQRQEELDHNGQVVHHAREAFTRSKSICEAGLRCVLWTVSALRDLHVARVIIAIDSAQVVEAITNPHNWPRFGLLLQEIQQLIEGFESWDCETVGRSANQAAVAIAKSVTRENRFQSYLALGGPSWLHDLISADD
ncbi:PREDICTED: uncharacterized protein LOC104751896 [Camelina sativa]|uniref:Uncharacterized protein LOC104751896 n=1 Tax=Camelina sativa TaxID=90675 RepID=A0ABM0WK62_CAMSA|nr:PREDICTED: uncharacterized protein LOC104751896 [Camelina sativa]